MGFILILFTLSQWIYGDKENIKTYPSIYALITSGINSQDFNLYSLDENPAFLAENHNYSLSFKQLSRYDYEKADDITDEYPDSVFVEKYLGGRLVFRNKWFALENNSYKRNMVVWGREFWENYLVGLPGEKIRSMTVASIKIKNFFIGASYKYSHISLTPLSDTTYSDFSKIYTRKVGIGYIYKSISFGSAINIIKSDLLAPFKCYLKFVDSGITLSPSVGLKLGLTVQNTFLNKYTLYNNRDTLLWSGMKNIFFYGLYDIPLESKDKNIEIGVIIGWKNYWDRRFLEYHYYFPGRHIDIGGRLHLYTHKGNIKIEFQRISQKYYPEYSDTTFTWNPIFLSVEGRFYLKSNLSFTGRYIGEKTFYNTEPVEMYSFGIGWKMNSHLSLDVLYTYRNKAVEDTWYSLFTGSFHTVIIEASFNK